MAEILVVDDESAVREALAALLNALGHHCVQAADGLEALDHLHHQQFDLILSDVLMPRMNGFQLLERLLPYIGERIPFLVVSSVKTETEIQDALHAGAFDYLTKPCEIDELREVLDRALAHRDRHRTRGRSTGGCIPSEALQAGTLAAKAATLDKELLPSGLPVFHHEPDYLAVAPPLQHERDHTPSPTSEPAEGTPEPAEGTPEPAEGTPQPATRLRNALRWILGTRPRRKAG